MRYNQPARAIAALVLICAAVLIGYQLGYKAGFRLGQINGRQAGEDRFDREWSDARGDPQFTAQIRDAQSRWNAKVGLPSGHIDSARTPIVMAFSDQVCVKLKLHSGSIGGSPVYCYRRDSTDVIRDDSNVE